MGNKNTVAVTTHPYIMQYLQRILVIPETAVDTDPSENNAGPVDGEADSIRAPIAGVPSTCLIYTHET